MRNYMNKTKTKLYIVWRGAKERCTNPNHKNYALYKDKWYSGWDASDEFITWAKENGYKEGLTIDRIDPNKGYSPENCQFITAKENTIKGNQQRRLKEYEYKGKKHTCKELSDKLDIPYDRLHQFLTRQKHSIEECIKRNLLCQIKADGFYNKTLWRDPK